MWRALRLLDSEIVAFADTDTEGFGEHFLTGLLGPSICDPAVDFVKGFFRRPFRSGQRVLAARRRARHGADGEAVAEPACAGARGVRSAARGGDGGRRELLEQIPFSAGYGVEIAMLIDAWRAVGLDGLAQVDLGVRQNRHQSLRELSAMSYAVLVAAQSRFLGAGFADAHAGGSISLPSSDGSAAAMESRRVTVEERPALARLRAGAAEPVAPIA